MFFVLTYNHSPPYMLLLKVHGTARHCYSWQQWWVWHCFDNGHKVMATLGRTSQPSKVPLNPKPSKVLLWSFPLQSLWLITLKVTRDMCVTVVVQTVPQISSFCCFLGLHLFFHFAGFRFYSWKLLYLLASPSRLWQKSSIMYRPRCSCKELKIYCITACHTQKQSSGGRNEEQNSPGLMDACWKEFYANRRWQGCSEFQSIWSLTDKW